MDPKKQQQQNNLAPIIHDIAECKSHLEGLLEKLGPNEYSLASGTLDWPTVLGVLGILSSDMIKISKFMREKQAFNLKNTVFVPKAFSEDIDPQLQSITKNRMSVFNQDLIPHILRTKLSPEMEEKERIVLRATREFEVNKNHEVMLISSGKYLIKLNLLKNFFEKRKIQNNLKKQFKLVLMY